VSVPGSSFADPAVAAVFETYPAPVRARLLVLRALIFETAAATDGVGPLHETLKWGQPAYLTPNTRSGSTIRIDRVRASDDIALYCHRQTDLVATFAARYPRASATRATGRSCLGKTPRAQRSPCATASPWRSPIICARDQRAPEPGLTALLS
jgi:hypothetical protein